MHWQKVWAGKLHCHRGRTRQSIVCLVPAASFAGNTETNFVTGFGCGSPTLTSTAPIVASDLLLFVSIAASPDWASLWFSLSVTSCGSIRGGGHLRWGIRGLWDSFSVWWWWCWWCRSVVWCSLALVASKLGSGICHLVSIYTRYWHQLYPSSTTPLVFSDEVTGNQLRQKPIGWKGVIDI